MRCEKLSVGTVVVAQVEGGEGMCKKYSNASTRGGGARRTKSWPLMPSRRHTRGQLVTALATSLRSSAGRNETILLPSCAKQMAVAPGGRLS